jgi:hypothetical protein
MAPTTAESSLAVVSALPSLVSLWDFAEAAGSSRSGRGPLPAALRERGGPVERVAGGVWSPWSARFTPGAWLEAPFAEAPQLDQRDEVTVIVWVRREPKDHQECQAIAGRWLETDRQRQYCLFIDLRIHDSAQQAALHVSAIGGPTPGERWCMDAAIGSTPVPLASWHCVVGTFARSEARLYVDGRLDTRERFNPYAYPGPLHASIADFTVGAVHRGGGMGNWFTGCLGGLAVCSTALDAVTVARVSRR